MGADSDFLNEVTKFGDTRHYSPYFAGDQHELIYIYLKFIVEKLVESNLVETDGEHLILKIKGAMDVKKTKER